MSSRTPAENPTAPTPPSVSVGGFSHVTGFTLFGMGCGSCGSGGRATWHQVRYSNGRVVRYATEVEARAAANATPKAEYQQVQR